MAMKISGLAVITGATSGIGLEFARTFAAAGASLVLGGRRGSLLEQRRSELRQAGAQSVELVIGDLNDEQVITQFEQVLRSQPCELLCNNAGFGSNGEIGSVPAADLIEMQRVLAEVPLRLCNAALSGMRERKSGYIINVGSLAGTVGVPGAATYVASKAFIERLSESMALENLEHGVVVQALTPGFVKTDFHRDVDDYRARQESRGLIRWMNAEKVVAVSLKRAERAHRRISGGRRRVPPRRLVVVVPGLAYSFLAGLSRFLPRRLVYRGAMSRESM